MERSLKDKLPLGGFLNVTPERSRTMAAIKGRHTKSTELKLRMVLTRAGIRGWKLHPVGLPGNPDVFFPEKEIVVFVDGCFWHGCSRCGHIPKTNSEFWALKFSRNRERDRIATKTLKKMGLRVLRIWEHSLKGPIEARLVLKKIHRELAR